MVERSGYDSPFVYEFLADPDTWAGAMELGQQRIEARGSRSDCEVWVAVDPIGDPVRVLVAEIPRESGPGALLHRLMAQARLPASGPPWILRMLGEIRNRPSPLLIVSEPGSGRSQLIEAVLFERFGDSKAAEFFHPGRLSGPVQLRELFGDSAGQRLGGEGAVVPLVDRGADAIVIEEVADLKPAAQSRLLDHLVRGDSIFWVLSTSSDLALLSSEGQFSPAFWSFLSTRQFVVPPLRKMSQFLSEEIERILEGLRVQYGRRVEVSEAAMNRLLRYDWPGNWDELKQSLETAYLLCHEGVIGEAELRLGDHGGEEPDTLNLRRRTADLERRLILEAYSLHAGNQVHMARALGISRGSLQYKLAKYGLQ
ncbi:MAG TPA: helix-turn-helix domain-containing protein [Leptospiraceae bacterium]|nr:helix-turn-helix domain-containing protein [Leptospiraceae bacterium]